MGRTKRLMRKFSSRKQNNRRQKKTRHTKYRKHRRIGKRNKSKRKSRKIFWGGFTPREQEQHIRRFEYIKLFLYFGKNYDVFIEYKKLDETLDKKFDTYHQNHIYDKLKNIIKITDSDEEYIKITKEYFENIKKFPLFDVIEEIEGEEEVSVYVNENYTTTIKMLEKIIDDVNLINLIRKVPEITGIDIKNIQEDENEISYVMLKDGDVPIVKSFIHNDYKYYLTLYTWLFARPLTPEEKLIEDTKLVEKQGI